MARAVDVEIVAQAVGEIAEPLDVLPAIFRAMEAAEDRRQPGPEKREMVVEALRGPFERGLDAYLARTDFPYAPEWIADPICRAVSLYVWDAAIGPVVDALVTATRGGLSVNEA